MCLSAPSSSVSEQDNTKPPVSDLSASDESQKDSSVGHPAEQLQEVPANSDQAESVDSVQTEQSETRTSDHASEEPRVDENAVCDSANTVKGSEQRGDTDWHV